MLRVASNWKEQCVHNRRSAMTPLWHLHVYAEPAHKPLRTHLTFGNDELDAIYPSFRDAAAPSSFWSSGRGQIPRVFGGFLHILLINDAVEPSCHHGYISAIQGFRGSPG